jgi:hypothetical protein
MARRRRRRRNQPGAPWGAVVVIGLALALATVVVWLAS